LQGIQGESGVVNVVSSGIGLVTYNAETATVTYEGPSGAEISSVLASGGLWITVDGHVQESDMFNHHFGLWAVHRTSGDIIFTEVTGHLPDSHWAYVGDGTIEFTGA
jgi:hypothetical protein